MESAELPAHEVVEPGAGEHERRLATGTLAQQAAQVVAVLSLLAAATALGRTLSLSEFGVYGLILSFSTYLLFIQGSVGAAAVKELASARDDRERSAAFTNAVTLYAAFGLLSAVLIAAGGNAILTLFDIPSDLRDEARLGLIALGLVTLVGWPIKIYQDVLRGSQLFVQAAVAEMCAYVALGGGLIVLLLVLDARLWILIGFAGTVQLMIGASAAVMVLRRHLPFHFRRAAASAHEMRRFVHFSLYLMGAAASDLVIYSLDRAVLAAFRPAATVGLYEAAVRPSNLVRQLSGTLSVTVFPAAAQYESVGDTPRTRELLVRGTRYVVAAVVPFVVTFIALAAPILDVWLGARYREAALAMSLLVTYWLFTSSVAVGSSVLMASGSVRVVAGLAWAIALVNLSVSLALTPSLGLEGVVLGTVAGYLVVFPVFLRVVVTRLPVTMRELVHEVWIPAFSLGLVLGGLLVCARLALDIETLVTVGAASVIGIAGYFAAYYLLWLRPAERRLLRSLLRPGRKPAPRK
jgi:O-antigen/teichoic acid export membrane protein